MVLLQPGQWLTSKSHAFLHSLFSFFYALALTWTVRFLHLLRHQMELPNGTGFPNSPFACLKITQNNTHDYGVKIFVEHWNFGPVWDIIYPYEYFSIFFFFSSVDLYTYSTWISLLHQQYTVHFILQNNNNNNNK